MDLLKVSLDAGDQRDGVGRHRVAGEIKVIRNAVHHRLCDRHRWWAEIFAFLAAAGRGAENGREDEHRRQQSCASYDWHGVNPFASIVASNSITIPAAAPDVPCRSARGAPAR